MSDSNYPSWFQSTEDGEYRAARPHAEVLQRLLSNTIDSATAANKLISLDYTNDDTPWALWNVIYEAAAEFSSSHSPLLALLTDVQSLDSQLSEFAPKGTPREWFACFGSMWRDKWDMLSPSAASGWTVSASQTRRRWININAFSAKLLATTSFSRGAKLRALGLSLFKKCLETDPNTYKEMKRRTQSAVQREPPWNKMDLGEILAADLCAAAQWLIHAEGLMWEDDRLDDTDFIRMVLPGQTDLWNGSQGLTEERWQLWKERFLFMAESEDIGPDAQRVARKAGQIMGAIHDVNRYDI
ncbi:Protein of unknown function DUF3632 [Penicillium concentricum]|uniref:Uncharacterized protein n=1 Tax=Penicillium concentricum TaxID=293559 RepID=A0A9W9SPE3_9EURO|nr:Protein of unknown function DUF3632 [Penicillium concentricum]KAJ5382192.1 Protein of unknown function DUF3632 [Penicillium concentricum]